MQLGFDDVLAEPDNAQGFEVVYRVAFLVFTRSKLWFYRLLSALVAVPAALVWAAVFAVVTVLYVWVASPLIRLLEFDFYLIRRVSEGVLEWAGGCCCCCF